MHSHLATRDEMNNPPAQFTEGAAQSGEARFHLAGRLDAYSVGRVWDQAKEALARTPDRRVVIDAAQVSYCDVAGTAMLVDLLREPRPAGAEVAMNDLPEQYQQILAQFDPADFREQAQTAEQRPSLPERTGRAAAELWADMRDLIASVGEAAAAIVAALRRPSSIRWRDALAIAEEAGANALPIVGLIAFLMGVILAFQAAIAMKNFGAEIFVADLVGIVLLRELGPLMTAILVAGRSAAAFAAEIGTMKVNEEINALTTMGLDPVQFLVVSRVLAAVAMMPLLVVFADLIGLIGGALVMRTFDIPFVTYYEEIVSAVHMSDFFSGLFKSLIFGVLVAGIGCLRGLQTHTGASAVGLSATSAVVSGIVLIVVTDGIFAVIFFYLNI
jgi:phospholipid/cholesterol/gamma-HCH transport system permease protein